MRSRNWFLILFAALCWGCGDGGANNAQVSTNAAPVASAANALTVNRVFEPVNTPTVTQGNFAARANKSRPEARSVGTPPPMQFQPADEDSQFATAMDSKGAIYEVRIFNSHPKLAKVESTWIDAKTRDITLTLKDGQVLSVKTDQVPSLKQAKVSQLIDVGGL